MFRSPLCFETFKEDCVAYRTDPNSRSHRLTAKLSLAPYLLLLLLHPQKHHMLQLHYFHYTLFSFMYLLLPSLCIRYLSNRQSPLHIPCSTVVELHSPLWTIAMSLSLLHTLRPADSVTSPSSILPECRREQRSPNLLAPGTCFMEETDRGVCEGGDGSGSNVSDGERCGKADEASPAHPSLTS